MASASNEALELANIPGCKPHALSASGKRAWYWMWMLLCSTAPVVEAGQPAPWAVGDSVCGVKGCKSGVNGAPWSTRSSGTNIDDHLTGPHHKLKSGTLPCPTAKKKPGEQASMDGYTQKIEPCQKKAFIAAIMVWMVSFSIPFHAVSSTSFKSMIGAACYKSAKVDVPSRRTLAGSALNEAVLPLDIIIKNRLANSSGYCITTDIWTRFTVPYISVNVHLVNSITYQQETFHLGIRKFAESHTSEAVYLKVFDILNDFGGSISKVISITTDGASNNNGFLPNLHGNQFKLTCVAHKLNNAMKKIIGRAEVKQILAIVQRYTRLFRKSPTATRELERVQLSYANGSVRKIKSMVVTRFNSFLIVLRSIQDQRHNITQAIAALAGQKCLDSVKSVQLNGNHFDRISEILKVLTPINDASIEFENRDLILSTVVVRIKTLLTTMNALRSSGNKYAALLIAAIRHQFSEILDPHSVAAQCCLLDYRYSDLLMYNAADHGIIKNNVIQGMLFWIKDSIVKEFDLSLNATSKSSEHEQASQSSHHQTDPKETDNPFRTKRRRVDHLNDLDEPPLTKFAKETLDRWLEYCLANADESDQSTPFEFWQKLSRDKHNLIREYAAIIYSIQATEVECERDFSQAGLSISCLF